MYEYINIKPDHYCDKQLTNADLSAYEGETKTFNVVYEVWTRTEGGSTIDSVNQKNKYTDKVTMYKLYSFKLSKTDSTTGVYEYTFTD